MKRSLLALAVAAGTLSTPANAASESENLVAVPLSAVPIDLSDMPATPQVYSIVMSGRSYDRTRPFDVKSQLTLRTSTSAGGVRFDDTLEFMGRTFTFDLRCSNQPLLPVAGGELRMVHQAKTLTASVQRSGDTLLISTGDEVREVELPPAPLTEAAIYRVVTRLPRTPGRAYTFDAYCPSSDLRPETPGAGEPCMITCTGPATIEADGQTIPCTEFVANVEDTLVFYVDADGVLRRVIADDGMTQMNLVNPEPMLAEAEDKD
jgi:hypothetical protein